MAKLPMLHHAMGYAAMGWEIFPLRARTKKPFGEKEWLEAGFKGVQRRIGDKVETKFGCLVATGNPALIEAWWKRWPDADIGLHCSRASGVWVLDADISESDPDPAKHKNGFKTLDAYAQEGLVLPHTVQQTTPSGGRHWFFRWPDGVGPEDLKNSVQKRLGNGLDTRAEGGYIVLPPSRHPDFQNRYAFDPGCDPADVRVADSPEWLLERLRRPLVAATASAQEPRAYEVTGLHPYVRRVLDDECARIRAAGPGTRHHTLFAACAAVGSRIGQGNLSRGYAEQHLIVAGLDMAARSGKSDWTDKEVRRVVKDGLDKGQTDTVPIPESVLPQPRPAAAHPSARGGQPQPAEAPGAVVPDRSVADGDPAALLWASAGPVSDLPAVATYLRRYTSADLPPTLRACMAPYGWRGIDGRVHDLGDHPCLLAAMGTGRVTGLYRRFLAPDGIGRAVIADPDRPRQALPSGLTLGGDGKGGGPPEMRFGPAGDHLSVAIGLECGLVLLDQAPGSVWATPSWRHAQRIAVPAETRTIYLAFWRQPGGRQDRMLDNVKWHLSAGGARLLRTVEVPPPDGCLP
jgi:hypothetical protein